MSNFNVEDCRQPSDTDSQWQLKKEFIEMYKYIFDKEKLLCLAQACCDIILKKSRYPDPVVKVITELSKPLKICERLLENNGNPSVKRPINEHQKDSEGINSIYKHSERPFKRMKFLANEEQANSPFLSTSTISQSSVQHFGKTYPVPLCNGQNAQIYSKSEQVLKTPVEHSEKSCKQMNFSANEGQTVSALLSTLTDRPSGKEFSSTHSKPLYNEQGAQGFSKSEQVLKTPVEHSEKSCKQMNFSANEGQTISAFLSTLTDRPSGKQFSSTHSKPLYNEQGAQSFSKSEQVLKTPVEHSEKSCKQMNFSANEGQTISTFLSTLTDRLQPSGKQFSSTHSKPLYNEQGAQSFSKSEQVLKTPVEHSEKSCKQMNFSANEGQTISTFLSTLTDRLQPSGKQFSSTHSKPLYNEQGAQSFSKSEQVLKTPVEHSEKSCKQMNFSANEGQTISTFLSTLTDRLQPSGKQFSSTHSKPLYSEQGARSLTISEQTFNRPAEYPEKSFKQKNFCDDKTQFNQTMLSTLTDVFFPLVEQFRNISSVILSNEQGAQSLSKSEKAFKAPIEHSERPFKQMDFWANKKQPTSSFLPSSTNLLQPSVEQFKNTHSVSSYNEKSSLSLSELQQTLKAPAQDFEKPQKQINLSGIKELLGSTLLPTQGAQNLSKSEKVFKAHIEPSETPFKQMGFRANEKQPTSSFLPSSTNLLQPSVEQFKNTHSISSYNEKSSLSLSKLDETLKVPAEDFERPQKQINLSGIKELLGSILLPTQGAQSLPKSEKALKAPIEHSEGPFKQMDFWANKKEPTSSFLPSSTNLLQPSVEQFKNTHSISSYNEKSSLSLSKLEQTLKVPAEGFERPQKQINLSGIKELLRSTLLPTLTNGLLSSKEQFTNTYPVPLSNEQEAQILSKSEEAVKTPYLLSNDEGVQILSKSEEVVRTASIGFKKEPKSIFKVKDISIPKENEDMIIKALGLPFIKEFADVVTGYGHKCINPLDVIHYASRRCNFQREYRFETDSDRDISTKFYSKFFLKDCLVASVTAFVKKEARLLAAEAGINTLVKLATDERSSFSSNPVEKPKHSIDRITDSEKVFEMFSRNINRANDEPAIVTLKNIASLLDMEDYLAFNVTSDIVSETETEYTCKFFLNDVLVSYATDEAIQNAKDVAAELGLIKLTNLAEYEINKSELRHKNKSVHSVTSYPSKAKNDLGKPFIINKALFDSSMRDGMVFLERDRYKISPQKFLKNMVSETAVFCRKDFSLKAAEPVSNSPYRKCVVSIGGKEVGVGVSFRPDNAKTIACTKAYIDLKRKYYTLKFKDDCFEGFLVTRDQLFNREPYYRNVIKKDFIKCTKLKTWFWFIDISKKDIGNCIERKTKQTSSKGTGYEPGRKPKFRDFRQFTDRLEPMLKRFKESQDYCDLLFSYDFTAKERGLIIKMVHKVGLRFQVLINDKDRIVCVRHKYEVRKLLNYLVRHGGYNNKFQLLDESETVI